MTNYKIIHNEAELNKFLDWLPENEKHQRYYISLFARKKYSSLIKADKACIKRTIAHKRDIVSKLKQLETPIGSYQVDGVDVPEESLAVYISVNPRDLNKAGFKTIRAIMTDIENGNVVNPYKISLNEIQKSGTGIYNIFDIDEKIDLTNLKSMIESILGDSEYRIIETRGGYHLIVKNTKELTRNWYPQILKITKIDQKGDLMSPLCGTIQGGFIPRFI